MTNDLKPTSKPLKRSQPNTISSSKPNVPTSFKLFNHNIKVKENATDLPFDRSGDVSMSSNVITLYTHECEASVVEHIFYHELVHLLLYYAGRDDLSKDEVLVDILGGLLAQYEATKRP